MQNREYLNRASTLRFNKLQGIGCVAGKGAGPSSMVGYAKHGCPWQVGGMPGKQRHEKNPPPTSKYEGM